MYMCAHVCAHVCMCACTCTCVDVCIRAYVYNCLNAVHQSGSLLYSIVAAFSLSEYDAMCVVQRVDPRIRRRVVPRHTLLHACSRTRIPTPTHTRAHVISYTRCHENSQCVCYCGVCVLSCLGSLQVMRYLQAKRRFDAGLLASAASASTGQRFLGVEDL